MLSTGRTAFFSSDWHLRAVFKVTRVARSIHSYILHHVYGDDKRKHTRAHTSQAKNADETNSTVKIIVITICMLESWLRTETRKRGAEEASHPYRLSHDTKHVESIL